MIAVLGAYLLRMIKIDMLLQRFIVALFFLPILIFLVLLGGPVFKIVVVGFLSLAAWELARLFTMSGYKPASYLLIAGAVVLAADRSIYGFENTPWVISLIILITLSYYVMRYEKGDDQAAINFSITLAGALYLGFIGAYLISIRDLPEGKWWLLLVLGAICITDGSAYLFGRKFGKHKMSPRLSPGKSWEGYFAGIVGGVLGSMLLLKIGETWLDPKTTLTIGRAFVVGLVMGVFPILGDLGESMFKRQAGAKDSGKLFPGHGGAFDRFDSWIWAGVLGYYLIVWFFTL